MKNPLTTWTIKQTGLRPKAAAAYYLGHQRQLSESDLLSRLLIAGQPPGVMVDVGAHKGTSLAIYAEAGWRIVAIEPDPDPNKLNALKAIAEQSLTSLHHVAIAETSGEKVDFYRSNESDGISTLHAFRATHQLMGSVSTETLANIVKAEGLTAIDFLKIDAEGYDLHVLKSHNWDIKPRAVLCEFEDNKTRQLGYTYQDMGNFLLEKGYRVYLSEWEPIKQYGGHHQWKQWHTYPAEVTNPECWGNFIAINPELTTRFEAIVKRFLKT